MHFNNRSLHRITILITVHVIKTQLAQKSSEKLQYSRLLALVHLVHPSPSSPANDASITGAASPSPTFSASRSSTLTICVCWSNSSRLSNSTSSSHVSFWHMISFEILIARALQTERLKPLYKINLNGYN